MKWRFKTFESEKPCSFSGELSQCISQLEDFRTRASQSISIVSLNIFIEGANLVEFLLKKEEVTKTIDALTSIHFIYEIIPQKAFERQLAMKAMCLDSINISFKQNLHIEPELKSVELLVGNSRILLSTMSSFSGDIRNDSTTCFKSIFQNLQNHDMEFGQVVRQWNFIGGIVDETTEGDGLTQNYQEFNDVRSHYYGPSSFNNGYPAATGIGMDIPGIILQTITTNNTLPSEIIPIDNPNQKPAHQYSEKVLIGNSCLCHKTTPKFERAKAVLIKGEGWIFVSGTAAIKGELHKEEQNIEAQTRQTLELIGNLVSHENLENHKIEMAGKNLIPATFRAYVKNEEDTSFVKRACKEYFEEAPGLVLIADICRSALLVEIECEFQIVLT